MDEMNKQLMYYNLYKVEYGLSSVKAKPISFTEFKLLKLKESATFERYDKLLNEMLEQISATDAFVFANELIEGLLTSIEIQVFLNFIWVTKGNKKLSTMKLLTLYEDHCHRETSWEECAKEENKEVVASGYSNIDVSAFKKAYGFYELSNNKILVTDL